MCRYMVYKLKSFNNSKSNISQKSVLCVGFKLISSKILIVSQIPKTMGSNHASTVADHRLRHHVNPRLSQARK